MKNTENCNGKKANTNSGRVPESEAMTKQKGHKHAACHDK